jgi:hypothetical protein
VLQTYPYAISSRETDDGILLVNFPASPQAQSDELGSMAAMTGVGIRHVREGINYLLIESRSIRMSNQSPPLQNIQILLDTTTSLSENLKSRLKK